MCISLFVNGIRETLSLVQTSVDELVYWLQPRTSTFSQVVTCLVSVTVLSLDPLSLQSPPPPVQ